MGWNWDDLEGVYSARKELGRNALIEGCELALIGDGRPEKIHIGDLLWRENNPGWQEAPYRSIQRPESMIWHVARLIQCGHQGIEWQCSLARIFDRAANPEATILGNGAGCPAIARANFRVKPLVSG